MQTTHNYIDDPQLSSNDQEAIFAVTLHHALNGAFQLVAERVDAAVKNDEPDILRIAQDSYETYMNIRHIIECLRRDGLDVIPKDPWVDPRLYLYTIQDLFDALSPESKLKMSTGTVQL